MLQSIKDFWHTEWTAFWGWTKVTAGAVIAIFPPMLHYLGGILNDPKVQAALDQLHMDPKIGLGLAALGAITLLSMSHA